MNKLEALRAAFPASGVDGVVVPRADEHLGEYVPPGAERLAWLTGFTGSAGLAVVLREEAALFTDGRYTLQAQRQLDPAQFQLRHSVDDPAPAWAAQRAGRIGYNPWLLSDEAVGRWREAGLEMVALASDPVDAIWTDRPVPPDAPARPHPVALAGRSSREKADAIAEGLRRANTDAAVITDPASVCWLLNIRGADVPFTPFALGFALLEQDGSVRLFMDEAKLPDETRAWLGNRVAVEPKTAFAAALAGYAGRRVRVDPSGSPAAVGQLLAAGGAEIVPGMDPCLLPKACKTPAEQDGARAAHARDAVAVVLFLRWLEAAAGTTEMQAAAELLHLRGRGAGFRGESFPAIVGSGEHGAVIHYRPTPETDRTLRENEMVLVDSGGQYPDGTTDVTRTVWVGPEAPPAEQRDRYTRVLKGHLALAATTFPVGVAGPHLDAFARRALWQVGLDYDHGTGHGVGSFLSVHEGPASLSRAGRMTPLAEGMIVSDEPGFYAPGAYGIRIENLLLVRPAHPGAARPFLGFETLTLAPYDRRLIEPALLDAAEIAQVDSYHARVLAEVGPALDPAARRWLETACAPL